MLGQQAHRIDNASQSICLIILHESAGKYSCQVKEEYKNINLSTKCSLSFNRFIKDERSPGPMRRKENLAVQ